jgi:hypothetical protein
MSGESESIELQGDDAALPQDAALVLTALEAAGGRENRRQSPRMTYRATALLWLFADAPGSSARVLYTRDVNERGIGFVTKDRLPLGYGGVLRLPSLRTPGQVFSIPCTLYRCRLAAPGWYEGALHFNRDQTEFRPADLTGKSSPSDGPRDSDADPPG